ncbi:MAG: NADH:ubiquinone reductase (Na(+)-transporting) subunit A [Flavobacteriales bacterium]|nr:MAG: NADH:ubiquinone reductase (Na(+)-transporting) subunit A [Flavobacteriales bacterium]
MSIDVKIRKGVNIKLKGTAEKLYANPVTTSDIVLKPTDFPGLTPKMMVKVGDKVKAGSPIFYNKENERILFTSPISGEVTEINRGEKRRILEVKVKADGNMAYETFKQGDPSSMSKEEILDNMLKSGVWPFIRQRPYDIVANPMDTPKAIHITAFDSAPLAPDYGFIVHGQGELLQFGLDALTKLTSGAVHLNITGNANADEAFSSAKNVQVNKISGPHPAGNVGVQLHHIDPINKGEVVWVLNALDVLTIGKLFKEGKFDASRTIALTGSKVTTPKYIKTVLGANVADILKGNVEEGGRFISGNPLTGTQVNDNGHLSFYNYQLTVIPAGGDYRFMGWLPFLGFTGKSLSRTSFSFLSPNKERDLDANMNGEERAFVMAGEYEKVFPMNIYPVHLVKSMITEDIDLMENLGVYEVAPEDFALCEFGCTSKIETQKIVRDALDLVRSETS